MKAQQLSIKYLAEQPCSTDFALLIPVFHEWIRRELVPEHILIDVADYRHVSGGPRVQLIAHEAHIGIDDSGGEIGLFYSRRRDPIGDARDKLSEALRHTLRCCALLESEPTLRNSLRLRPDRFTVRVLSRLVADNSPHRFAELTPIVHATTTDLYGPDSVTVAHLSEDLRAPLSVEVTVRGQVPSFSTLLTRCS